MASTVIAVDRLFDGEQLRNEPLLLEIVGENISALRPRDPEASLPSGAVDARGLFVMPGLFDAHAHVARAGQFEADEPPNPAAIVHNLGALLRSGITSVGDMGCTAGIARALRRLGDEHPEAGPTLRISGPIVADPMGYPLDWMGPVHKKLGAVIAVADPQAAKRAVEQLARAGMDHVKITIMHHSYSYKPLQVFSRSTAKMLVEMAHANGMRVMAHAHYDADYRLALDAGADALMHSAFDPLSEETVARVRDAGILVCPTLWIFHSTCLGAELRFDRDPDRSGAVVGAVRRSFRKFAEAYAESGDVLPEGIAGGLPKERAKEGTRHAAANLKLLSDAGVRLAHGSDGPFGFSILGRPWEELELMERAGASKLDCLRAATSGAADLLGTPEAGRLQPGKRADILLVGGDPLGDLSDLRQMKAVYHRGRPVSSTIGTQLLQTRAVVSGFAATLYEAAKPSQLRA